MLEPHFRTNDNNDKNAYIFWGPGILLPIAVLGKIYPLVCNELHEGIFTATQFAIAKPEIDLNV